MTYCFDLFFHSFRTGLKVWISLARCVLFSLYFRQCHDLITTSNMYLFARKKKVKWNVICLTSLYHMCVMYSDLWFSYALQIAYFKFVRQKKKIPLHFWLTKMRDNNFLHVSFIVTLWLTKWICFIKHVFSYFFYFHFFWRKKITTTLCLMPYTASFFEFPSKTHLPAPGWESIFFLCYPLASYVAADRVRIVQCI